MFPILKIFFALVMSKQGRKALRGAVEYLRSDEGRKTVAQIRRVATGPEAQHAAKQVVGVVRQAAARAKVGRARKPPPPPGWRDRARQRVRSVRVRR